MYTFRRIFQMDLKNLFLNPMWIFYCTAFPFLMVALLGLLTSGMYGSEVTSFDYYSITLMIYSALNAATLGANSFMEKRIKGPNMRLIYAPAAPFFIYFSKILATTVFTTACYTFTCLLLHLIFRVNFGGSHAIYLWLLMVLVIVFSSALSVMMCCLLHTEEAVNQLVSTVITLLCVGGGLFFPVSGLGRAMEIISNICPTKWVAAASFQIIYDQNFSLYPPACIILLFLALICIGLCSKFFKMEDYT